jgi:hypothetical protein
MGEMSSNGHRIYGYHYVKKTSTAPATLAINEEQAAVVRSIFEMFASGTYGLVTISRHLEERRDLTSKGRQRWDNDPAAPVDAVPAPARTSLGRPMSHNSACEPRSVWLRSLTHSPVAVIHSPAEIVAE